MSAKKILTEIAKTGEIVDKCFKSKLATTNTLSVRAALLPGVTSLFESSYFDGDLSSVIRKAGGVRFVVDVIKEPDVSESDRREALFRLRRDVYAGYKETDEESKREAVESGLIDFLIRRAFEADPSKPLDAAFRRYDIWTSLLAVVEQYQMKTEEDPYILLKALNSGAGDVIALGANHLGLAPVPKKELAEEDPQHDDGEPDEDETSALWNHDVTARVNAIDVLKRIVGYAKRGRPEVMNRVLESNMASVLENLANTFKEEEAYRADEIVNQASTLAAKIRRMEKSGERLKESRDAYRSRKALEDPNAERDADDVSSEEEDYGPQWKVFIGRNR